MGVACVHILLVRILWIWVVCRDRWGKLQIHPWFKKTPWYSGKWWMAPHDFSGQWLLFSPFFCTSRYDVRVNWKLLVDERIMKEILYHLGCIKHCVYIMGSTTYQLVQPNPKESRGSGSITWDSVLDTSQLCLHRNGPGLIRTGKRVSQNVSKHKKMNNKKSSEVCFCLKAQKKTNKINIYWTTNTNHFILQPDLTSAFFSFARTFRGAKYSKRSQILCETSADTNKKGFSVYSERFLGKIRRWNLPLLRLKLIDTPSHAMRLIRASCDTRDSFYWETMHNARHFLVAPEVVGHTTGFLASNSGTDALLGGRRLQWSWHALDLSELA